MLISGIFWFMHVNFIFFPNTESNFFEVNSKALMYISMYLQTHIYTSYFTHRSYNNQFSIGSVFYYKYQKTLIWWLKCEIEILQLKYSDNQILLGFYSSSLVCLDFFPHSCHILSTRLLSYLQVLYLYFRVWERERQNQHQQLFVCWALDWTIYGHPICKRTSEIQYSRHRKRERNCKRTVG